MDLECGLDITDWQVIGEQTPIKACVPRKEEDKQECLKQDNQPPGNRVETEPVTKHFNEWKAAAIGISALVGIAYVLNE